MAAGQRAAELGKVARRSAATAAAGSRAPLPCRPRSLTGCPAPPAWCCGLGCGYVRGCDRGRPSLTADPGPARRASWWPQETCAHTQREPCARGSPPGWRATAGGPISRRHALFRLLRRSSSRSR
eukprot:647403-Prymnesium_polylepis.2